MVDLINASGASILFIGLGCPKQEQWMAEHRGRIRAVMVGVGAAFDYHAGTLKRAPQWMQQSGLEWLFRFVKEPRRLWRRYLTTNTIFVVRIARQFLRHHASVVMAQPPKPTKRTAVVGDADETQEIEEPTR
jgi:N-acetylglucosaminyldiphosphoundecaprenol N-acetyl-beta-D-mannosaminyltransferase